MKNPFGFADEFEAEENPLIKKTTQATQSVSDAAAKQAQQQAQDTNKAIVDQLYSPSSGQPDSGTNESGTQPPKGQALQNAQKSQANAGNAAKSPEEQVKLEKLRRELFAKNYGGQFSLENQLERQRKQTEQEEAQKKRTEEQEEEQKKMELEQRRQAEPLSPPTKGRSRMGPSFTSTDMSKKKTETFRGASG